MASDNPPSRRLQISHMCYFWGWMDFLRRVGNDHVDISRVGRLPPRSVARVGQTFPAEALTV